MHLLIRPETTAAKDAIRRVNRAAFCQIAQADLADALMRDRFARIVLVAVLEDPSVTQLQFLAAGRFTPARQLTGDFSRFLPGGV